MAPSRISPPPEAHVLTSNGASVPLHSSTSSAPAVQQPVPVYYGYHHVTWWVGNAKQAASYYVTRFGFRRLAYRGLETGSRLTAHHVISNGGVVFEFVSPVRAPKPAARRRGGADGSAIVGDDIGEEGRRLLAEMHEHLAQHGDAVKDVAFEVDSAEAVYSHAVAKGAVGVMAPTTVRDEKAGGEVVMAAIRTYGDTTHTLIEKRGYGGVFLPGYRQEQETTDPLDKFLPVVQLEAIDHCVGNQDWDAMEKACEL